MKRMIFILFGLALDTVFQAAGVGGVLKEFVNPATRFVPDKPVAVALTPYARPGGGGLVVRGRF